MKLFIPACGNRIKLSSDWTFTLYHEHRNDSLFKKIHGKSPEYNWREPIKSESVTVPTGTTLEIDRVYIRQFSKTAETAESDYDSLTFKVIDGQYAKSRFWAKLADVNNIEYELPPDVKGSKGPSTAPKKMKIDAVRNIVCGTLVSERGWQYHRDVKSVPGAADFGDKVHKILVKHTQRSIQELDAKLATMNDVPTMSEWCESWGLRRAPDDVMQKTNTLALKTHYEEFFSSNFAYLNLYDYLDRDAIKATRDAQGRLIRKWVGRTVPDKFSSYLDGRVLKVRGVVLTITMTPDETDIENVTLTCEEEL